MPTLPGYCKTTKQAVFGLAELATHGSSHSNVGDHVNTEESTEFTSSHCQHPNIEQIQTIVVYLNWDSE